jgi:hypothetical protein
MFGYSLPQVAEKRNPRFAFFCMTTFLRVSPCAGGAGQSMRATVDALPLLIMELREAGYTFVTVDKLLGVPTYR